MNTHATAYVGFPVRNMNIHSTIDNVAFHET